MDETKQGGGLILEQDGALSHATQDSGPWGIHVTQQKLMIWEKVMMNKTTNTCSLGLFAGCLLHSRHRFGY